MGSQENSRRTFVVKLKFYCGNCEDCVNKVTKMVKKIQGVDSIEIAEEGKATISGNVDPHKVIKELEKHEKIRSAELWGEEEEEEESPVPQVNEQKMQISVGKISDQRKVAPAQCPDVKPMDKRIHDCYPKHDHELELRSYNKHFTCDGCKEEGLKTRYRCEPCNYELHEECRYPEPMIKPDLFQGSTFVFRQKPGNKSKICNACGRKIYGCFYHCEVDNLNLHPRCSNLRGKLGMGDTEFVLCKKAKKDCFWCKKKQPSWLAKNDNVQAWCYVSKCNKYYCHVYCVSEMVHEAWKRGDLDRKDDDNDVDDVTSMALENVDLKLVAKSGGGGSSGFLKTISMFLRAIIGILFGDPTVLMLTVLVELIQK